MASQQQEQSQKVHSVHKNHVARFENFTISDHQSIFIPVSVGTNSYQKEPFLALCRGLVKVFAHYPETPVYILVGDSVQAENLVFKNEKFKYKKTVGNVEIDLFKPGNEDALEAELQKNLAEALKDAIRDGDEWIENVCNPAVKEVLEKHFKNIKVVRWEEKKRQIKMVNTEPVAGSEVVQGQEANVGNQTVSDDGAKELAGYLSRAEEYDKKNVPGTLFHGLVRGASAQYYSAYVGREIDGINILTNAPIRDETFVRQRSEAYLKQDIIVVSEAIKDLQDAPGRPDVFLAYPYPQGHPTQSATLRAIQCNLGVNGVRPRLETPEIHNNPSNSKGEKHKNTGDGNNKDNRPRSGSDEAPVPSEVGPRPPENGGGGGAAVALASTTPAPTAMQATSAPSASASTNDVAAFPGSAAVPGVSSLPPISRAKVAKPSVQGLPPAVISNKSASSAPALSAAVVANPSKIVTTTEEKPADVAAQRAPGAVAPYATLFPAGATEEYKKAQEYRKAGQKLSALRGTDPDADDPATLFFQYKAFRVGMQASAPITIPTPVVIHAGTSVGSKSP